MKPPRIAAVAAAALFAVALVGCSSAPTDGGSSGPADTVAVSAAQETITALTKSPGTYASPPTTAPEHDSGKTIWVISCGEAYDLCARPTAAAVTAVESLGWTAKVFDTKGDPTAANTGIRQALAQGADGVYTYYIDCSYVLSSLKEANAAGLPVVAAESGPCPGQGDGVSSVDTSTSGDGHYTFIVNYAGGATPAAEGEEASFTDMLRGMGIAGASAAIANLEGDVNALIYMDDAGYGAGQVAKGAEDTFADCSSCTSKTETVPYGDIGTDALRERVQQDLLKNPNVNTVISNYDSLLTGGIQQAVQASKRDIFLVSGEGGPLGMDSVRAGLSSGGAALSIEWESWAGIDALLHILAGEEPANSGIGLQWYDKENNTPETGGFVAPFDYEEIYKTAWGVN
jgi:ribose transport system substrate-binding protein